MQEYFERAAAVYIDLPGPSKVLEGGAGKAAYEDAGAAVGCGAGCLKLAMQTACIDSAAAGNAGPLHLPHVAAVSANVLSGPLLACSRRVHVLLATSPPI